MPAPNEFWKTEHLLYNKQAHNLELLLFHPILEEKNCRAFVKIFEQGDYDSWKDAFKYHFTGERGDRLWKPAFDKPSAAKTKGSVMDNNSEDDQVEGKGWQERGGGVSVTLALATTDHSLGVIAK